MAKLTTPKGREVEAVIIGVTGSAQLQQGRIRFRGINVSSWWDGEAAPHFVGGINTATATEEQKKMIAENEKLPMERAIERADQYIDRLQIQ